MQVQVDQLARELKALQGRRGVQQAHRDESVGVLITQALSLAQYRPGDERRKALISGLVTHAEVLPADLSFVFLTACAIRPELRPVLTERLEYAAHILKVNVRTVWRRLDVANLRVAASLAGVLQAPESAPPPEWVLTSLHAETDLTHARPTFLSTHTVRVVSPYLTEITERLSFPGAGPDADPEFMVTGDCALIRVERPYQVSWTLRMRLRRQFACGEQITYSIRLRAPSRRLVHPMSVMLPERECRVFSTKVNFGRPSVASRVWRLDGVPAPVAELDDPAGVPLDPHTEPILGAEYQNMVRGRVYGLRWEWAEPTNDDNLMTA